MVSGAIISFSKLDVFSHMRCGAVSRSRESLQIRQVNGGIGFLCEVVGEKAEVRECPAKDIVDDEDGGGLGVTSHVSGVVCKLDLLASRLPVPVEARFATIPHFGIKIVVSWKEVNQKHAIIQLEEEVE
jgi:hypothetical protein